MRVCFLFFSNFYFYVSNFYFQNVTWHVAALIYTDPCGMMSTWWITVLLHCLTGYHHGSLSGCIPIIGTVMEHYLVTLQKHQWRIKAINTWNQLQCVCGYFTCSQCQIDKFLLIDENWKHPNKKNKKHGILTQLQYVLKKTTASSGEP